MKKYKQLYQLLVNEINAGVLIRKLPSVRSFAATHQVSISTVLKTYTELEKHGLVIAEPKRGYFIQPSVKLSVCEQYTYGSQSISVKSGKDIYQAVQYSLNDPELLPLSATAPSSVVDSEKLLVRVARKCLTKDVFSLNREDPVTGLPELKLALCQNWFNRFGQITPDQLVITSGRIQALQTLLTALNLVNKHIAIESPVSFYFRSGLAPHELELTEIPQQADYQDEIRLLDNTYLQKPFDCYLVNPSFNDPTGRLLSDENKIQLLTWAKKHNVIIIEYDRSPLNFYGSKPLSLAELATKNGITDIRLFSIGDFFDTISPTFSVGYVICFDDVEQVKLTKQVTSEPPEILIQQMLIHLLNSGKYSEHLNAVRNQMRINYQKCLGILGDDKRCSVNTAAVEGGPCLWMRLPSGYSSEKLWQQALKQKVAIAPGKVFSFAENYDEYFRITFALPFDQRMEEGLVDLYGLIDASK